MSRSSSIVARILVGIIGAIALAIGARIAYTSYRTEKILYSCITGSSCSSSLSGLALQSAYSNAKGEVLLGAVLAFFGVLTLMYTFLFAGRYSSQKIIQADQK